MDLNYRFLIVFVVFHFIFLSIFLGVNYGFVQMKRRPNPNKIESMAENSDKRTNAFFIENYKPILNARKKKVEEVCQKYNLTSGRIPKFRNLYCTFQYKVWEYWAYSVTQCDSMWVTLRIIKGWNIINLSLLSHYSYYDLDGSN